MKRPAVSILIGAALLVGVVLHTVLGPSVTRMPGLDSVHHYAWEAVTRAALSAGHLPFWNPYHFAGTPHFADPQTTVLYPPALLLRWLPVPAFLGWMIALHLWIAAAGTLLAARVIGLSWMAAAASAVAVMLGGSVPGWIYNGHVLILYTLAWIPWALALAIVSLRTGSVFPSGWLVAVLVLQFLTGYLQGSLYLTAALALYFLFSAVWPDTSLQSVRRWTPLVQFAFLGLFTAAAAAFQLLPTLVLVAGAGRSAGISYADALDGSWRLADLTTFFFPFYGIPADHPVRMLSDRLAYVGWLLTAFVPFAFYDRNRRRTATFFGLLAALLCALALGDTVGLYRLHYALFPGLRIPGRVVVLATVCVALLGGLGIDVFASMAAARQWRRLTAPLLMSLAAIAVAWAAALNSASAGALPAPGWPWLPAMLASAVLIFAVATVCGLRRLACAVAVAAVAVDVGTLSAGGVATVPYDTAADIRRWIGPPDGGRAISLCENRVGARDFLLNREPTLDGVPALYLRDYAQWANIAKSGEVPPSDGFYRRVGSEGPPPARADLIDMANVTRIIECEHDGGSDISGVVIRHNSRAWPRAVWTCDAEDVSRREAIGRFIQGRFDASGRLHSRHYIRLRWVPGLSDARRTVLEGVHHLEDGVDVEGVTWRYLLGDESIDAVLRIMRDPEVEDTHGVDRQTGVIVPRKDLLESLPVIPGDDHERSLIPGPKPCQVRADVTTSVMDRIDGRVSASLNAPVDGFVFFSEPYYRERHAYVDGHRVTALKANLAFTAVPVSAGPHRVELRYVPSSFYVGSAISGMTAAAYAGLVVRRRRRRKRHSA